MIRELEPKPATLSIDFQYLNLLDDILKNGAESPDRTGTGTKKVFGKQLKADLSQGFPLLTTKKVWFRGVKEELLWMISGERNIRTLILKDVNIWNEWPFQKYLQKTGLEERYPKYTPAWNERMSLFINKIKSDVEFAEKWGDLGPVYGFQWRHWKTKDEREIDQLAQAIDSIKNNPDSRRINITAWNPEDTLNVALPPCHLYFQFQVDNERLNTFMVMRSVDTFLGLPFNIASYALLTHLVAQVTNKIPGELTLALADTHLYLNHIPQAKEQLLREPRELPQIFIDPGINNINNIKSEGIKLINYNPHPKIAAPISV